MSNCEMAAICQWNPSLSVCESKPKTEPKSPDPKKDKKKTKKKKKKDADKKCKAKSRGFLSKLSKFAKDMSKKFKALRTDLLPDPELFLDPDSNLNRLLEGRQLDRKKMVLSLAEMIADGSFGDLAPTNYKPVSGSWNLNAGDGYSGTFEDEPLEKKTLEDRVTFRLGSAVTKTRQIYF
jgi:hypothetical protein